jgi:hypothetical protein
MEEDIFDNTLKSFLYFERLRVDEMNLDGYMQLKEITIPGFPIYLTPNPTEAEGSKIRPIMRQVQKQVQEAHIKYGTYQKDPGFVELFKRVFPANSKSTEDFANDLLRMRDFKNFILFRVEDVDAIDILQKSDDYTSRLGGFSDAVKQTALVPFKPDEVDAKSVLTGMIRYALSFGSTSAPKGTESGYIELIEYLLAKIDYSALQIAPAA